MTARANDQKAAVSGEIMTPERRTRRPPVVRKALHAVDADFEIVTPRPVPTDGVPQSPGLPRKDRSRSLRISASVAALIVTAFVTAWSLGEDQKPTQSGVDLADVTSSIDRSGVQALVKVDGTVVNRNAQAAPIAPIAVTLTDGNALTTRYLVRVAAARLGPGDRFAFSTRLSVPRDDAQSVKVGFAE